MLDGNNDEVTVEDEQKQKQLAMGWYRNPSKTVKCNDLLIMSPNALTAYAAEIDQPPNSRFIRRERRLLHQYLLL